MATTVETKFVADTKHWETHLKIAERAANNTRKASRKLDQQNSALTKSFRAAGRATATMYGPLNGVSGRLTAMATALATGQGALIAASTAVATFATALTFGVREIAKFEVAMKRAEAVQVATGNASGFTAQQIRSMSEEIALSTLASTNGVLEAAAALGTFSTVAGQTFEDALRSSQDVAEAMGVDIKSAAVQLGKALADPTQGLSALTRAGVTFSESTKEQIKAAQEFGDILKAQGLIMEAVKGQLGGVAEAVASDTMIGAWDTLTQRVSEFFTKNKKAVAFVNLLTRGINALANALDRATVDTLEESEARIEKLKKKAEDIYLLTASRSGSSEQYEQALQNVRDAEAQHSRIWLDQISERLEKGNSLREGEAKQEQIQADARLEAAKKNADKYLRVQTQLYSRLEKARQQQFQQAQSATLPGGEPDIPTRFAGAQDAEIARFQAQQAKLEQERLKTQEKFKFHKDKLAEWDATYARIREEMTKTHLAKMAQIQDDFDQKDLAEKSKTVFDDLEKEQMRLDRMSDQIDMWGELGSGIENALSQASQAMRANSKEQRAFAVVSRATAMIVAAANIGEAMAKAMSSSGHPLLMAAAVAQAVALGAQAFGMIRSGGRAMGGPVSAGGTYWVGERGPELVHFNRPGHVTPADKAMGNVNIQLIEDASRAGQQTLTEEGIIQIAVASIRGELQRDVASGRGIFRQAEQTYPNLRRF